MPFGVGEAVGPYRILEQLGQGGMAKVLKAYHAALDRYVAIKALHPAFLEDPNFLARFQREARVVAKLEHPNIVPIYDFSEHEGRPYLVMKFIDGETLKARLSRGRVTIDELNRIVESVGSALAFAHDKGILHRDIKPSNVLLAEDGIIYLADFGLARIAQAGESTLSSDMMLGTPQYISPEQAMGVKELDEGTDIYSFGVLLYELIVGRVPFSADTPFSVIHDHIYTPLPLPTKINPAVPQEIERVLLKSLAKERPDRFNDIDELTRAYYQAIKKLPVPDETLAKPVSQIDDQATEDRAPSLIKQDITQIGQEVFPTISSIRAVDHKLQEDAVVEKDLSFITDESLHDDSEEVFSSDDISNEVNGVKIETERKKFWRGWYLIPILTIACLCVFVVWGISRNQGTEETTLEKPASETSTQIGETNPFEDKPPLVDFLPSDEFAPIPLENARRKASQNPDDPIAQLDLAAAYWDEGQPERAHSTLSKAIDLAGDDAYFYFEAGAKLAIRGVEVLAVQMYLEAIHLFQERVPDIVWQRFHRVVYEASFLPEAFEEIPISAIGAVDEEMMHIATARHSLYNGNPGESQRTVNELLLDAQPVLAETLLLQAEISIFHEDIEAAREVLSELLRRNDVPEWVRFRAQMFLDDIQRLIQTIKDVRNNPDDAWARLALFETLLDLGRYEHAEEVLRIAIDIAHGDPEFFYTAGNLNFDRGIWQYAAPLFLYSDQYYSGKRPEDLSDKIHQSMFFAAGVIEANEILSMQDVNIDPLLFDLFIARYHFYFEDQNRGIEELRGISEQKPDFVDAQLFESEIFLVEGDIDRARVILERLFNDPSVPIWIREEAENLFREINP